MENIDNRNNILNIENNQKKNKKPLEDIINNYFSMFKMEDIIHIFFFLNLSKIFSEGEFRREIQFLSIVSS